MYSEESEVYVSLWEAAKKPGEGAYFTQPALLSTFLADEAAVSLLRDIFLLYYLA